MRVLLASARAATNDAGTETQSIVPAQGLDWALLLSLATRHRVVPLLWRHIERRAATTAPADFMNGLRSIAFAGAARNLLLTDELRRMLRALQATKIPVLAYKGPAVAAQLYGNVSLRTFLDVDLLVRPVDFERARESLGAIGYRPRRPLLASAQRAAYHTECDEELVHDEKGTVVELHWAVVPPYFSFPLSTDDLMTRSVKVPIDDFAAAVPAPEDLLLLLAMNGAKDLWLRLEPACLVARLLRTHTIAWAAVRARARSTHSERMLGLALCLASELLGAALPPQARSLIDGDRDLGPLVEIAKQRLLDPAPRTPGPMATTRFRIGARERWIDRARYCMMRALLPTIADCNALRLPGPLWPAAGLVRPLRLLARVVRHAT